jgi:uncharacterized protein YdeI (YjbR/CyaY-like superfamily)
MNDARVDAYVAKAPEFARPVLKHLRALVHEAGGDVVETMKWSRPNFMANGKIVCQMTAFKEHCGFGFWGPEMAAVLREAGIEGEDASGSFGRIRGLGDLPEDKKLRGWIRMAFALARGSVAAPVAVKSAKKVAAKGEVVVPEDLAAALSKQKGAAARFAEMSASSRREYVEWIVEAKRAETRARRVDEAAGWIAEGKRRNWKYEAR